MVLTKRNPLAVRRRAMDPLVAMRGEIDRLFNQWLTDFDVEPMFPFEVKGEFFPVLDIREVEGRMEITAELPGMDEKQVRIELAGHRLFLTGEKEFEKEENTKGIVRSERRFGAFRRVIPLPWEVEAKHVEARLEGGLLTIAVKKPEELAEKSHTIHIKT